MPSPEHPCPQAFEPAAKILVCRANSSGWPFCWPWQCATVIGASSRLSGHHFYRATTTPFDMVVLNNLGRFQLALDAIRRIPRLGDQVEKATARYWTPMERHKLYISTATTCRRFATGVGRLEHHVSA